MITWRKLTEADFPLLRQWLLQPHVARWWNHDTSPEEVARDFGPVARGEEPSEDLLVFEDGTPVGLVQRSRYGDYPDYIAELAPFLAVDEEAVSVDYLVGDLDRCGRGLGPRIIAAVIAETWSAYPLAPSVVVPVVAANRTSWRALEKAGLSRVAEGELEPDNPVDDHHHVVYRVDRPSA